mmetsp:Transcript_1047/g.1424  ORF Transcript_1047/g.1424 Transcript_1047/m.1424 type:complete len:210 (-) Transcript_1047:133-762(-)
MRLASPCNSSTSLQPPLQIIQQEETPLSTSPPMLAGKLQPQREKVRQKLCAALATEGMQQCPALAIAIEEELHRQLDDKTYLSQARSVLFNLNDFSNNRFKAELMSGALKIEELPKMTPEQMASDFKNMERARLRQLSMEACDADWDLKRMQKFDGMLTCPRCKGAKTSYQQLQAGHGLDEPMTTFVSCYTCGNRWKFDDIGASEDAQG